MTPRGQHLIEMRYANEHRCSLKAARDALARLKWQAGQRALENAMNARSGASAPFDARPEIEQWWQKI